MKNNNNKIHNQNKIPLSMGKIYNNNNKISKKCKCLNSMVKRIFFIIISFIIIFLFLEDDNINDQSSYNKGKDVCFDYILIEKCTF